jgi:hypothetical protein
MVADPIFIILAPGAGAAAEADTVIAIAAGASNAKIIFRIGRFFSLMSLPFLGTSESKCRKGETQAQLHIARVALFWDAG